MIAFSLSLLLIAAAPPFENPPGSAIVELKQPIDKDPLGASTTTHDVRFVVERNPYSPDLAPSEWRNWLIVRGYTIGPSWILNPHTGERFDFISKRTSVLVRRLTGACLGLGSGAKGAK